MRTPLVVGNWKMNGGADDARALAQACGALAQALSGQVEVGVAPSAIWLERVRKAGPSPLLVFAQNSSAHVSGAHTGELAVSMLADAGMDGVILGHSERRHVYGEDEATIGAKVVRAREAGLQVILCVGETLEERHANRTAERVVAQLQSGLAGVESLEGITVAYEPVWAIGTGETATPAQAGEVHAGIRTWLADRYGHDAALEVRLLYGGSVNAGNAAALLATPEVDGALVGGASLQAEGFGAIARAAL